MLSQIYINLKNYVPGVVCLDVDVENESVSCVKNNNFIEIQVYNDLFYLVTITDDLTGDEVSVQILPLNNIINLIKKM